MKKIPDRVIVIAVVLILLALCFFRKEGYNNLNSEQSKRLNKFFDDYEIPMNDRDPMWEYIRSTSEQKETMMTPIVTKYVTKTDFMRKLRAFSRTP